MRVIYKRSLTVLSILIAVCGLIGIAYLFYDKVLKEDTYVVVDDELSINYLNGYKISGQNIYKFSITNNSDNDVYYNIMVNDLENYSSKVTYNLLSKDASVNIVNMKLNEHSDILLDNVLIQGKSTQNFTLQLEENTLTTLEISVKKAVEIEEYFYATILKNNTTKKETMSEIGKDIAEENEGLIEDLDDLGATYYFRGNVSNNYVSFASKMWRIVRINGDGTVKLVLDDITETLTSFHDDQTKLDDYAKTIIAKSLDSFYEEALKQEDSLIANAKYCLEFDSNDKKSDYEYNAYTRVAINKIPTFNCLGTKYTSKIGLLNIDEVIYAGATLNDENKKYYLYNKDIEANWWTSNIAKSNSASFYPFIISTNGKVENNVVGNLNRGLRPTINLIKNIKVSGSGTISDPYVIIK